MVKVTSMLGSPYQGFIDLQESFSEIWLPDRAVIQSSIKRHTITISVDSSTFEILFLFKLALKLSHKLTLSIYIHGAYHETDLYREFIETLLFLV